MGRRIYATTTSDNSFMLSGSLIAELPMALDSDLTDLMHTYGTATFKLAINDPACPEDWESLVEPIKNGIVVMDDDLLQPVWAGYINGTPVMSGEGTRTINCVSYEGYLNQRYVPDIPFQTMDQISWVKHLIDRMNADHRGMGITCEVTATSGTTRALSFLQSDWKTYLEAINEIAEMQGGFEWDLEIEWANVNWTRIKKTLRPKFPTVGTVTNTPNITFEYPGNIQEFEYEKYFNEGKFATHFIVTGDGSGVKQVKSDAKVDEAKESLEGGYPRIEVKEHVSGIDYANDATTLAAEKAKGYHNPPVAIQVSLDSSLNTQDIKKGDSAYVSIDSTELKLEGVWRVTALSIDNDGNIKPTLAPMNDGSRKFPLIPGDPTNPKRESDTSFNDHFESNPFSQGWEIPKSDGTGNWTFDPDNGYGFTDSTGTWEPIGGGGGGGGGSYGGTLTRVIVANYDPSTFMATVHRVGEESNTFSALNSSGKHLLIGDYVVLGESTETSGFNYIVSRERIGFTDPTTYTRFRVHEDWPVNISPYNVSRGMSFLDYDNAFKRGEDCVIVDANTVGQYNFYNRVSGNAGALGVPANHNYIPRATHSYNGGGYRWFIDSATNTTPRLFKASDVEGGWELVPGLPETPDKLTPGIWTTTSISNEVFTIPICVTMEIDIVTWPAYTPRNVPASFTIWKLSADGTHMTPWHTFPVSMYWSGATSASSSMNSTSPSPLLYVYASGDHVYVLARVNNVQGSGSSATYTYLWYVDMSKSPVAKEVATVPNSSTPSGLMQGYLGVTSLTNISVSNDGTLYTASRNIAYFRGLTDSSYGTVQFALDGIRGVDTAALGSQIQRVGVTDRYIVSTAIMMYQDAQYSSRDTYEARLIEIYRSNASVGTVKTSTDTSGDYDDTITQPVCQPDDSIMYQMAMASSPTANRELGRIVP